MLITNLFGSKATPFSNMGYNADSIGELERIGIDSVSGVLALAVDRNLTFYDASYSFIAETKRFRLITQDEKLRKKTKNAIGIEDLGN